MTCKKRKHNWQFTEKRIYTNPGEAQQTVYEFVCGCGDVKTTGWKIVLDKQLNKSKRSKE